MKAKRALSLILSLLMLLSCIAGLDFSAYALDSSGKCGDNVTYIFNSSTGELVISGTGAMKNYDGGNNRSPFYWEYSIKSVKIFSGVTSIGDHAFDLCTGLTKVTIPNSVTSIGNDAFSSCMNLVDVSIPSSVTSIGSNAFYGCIELTSLTIPDSVKNIGNGAFSYCSSIKSIAIPNGIKKIALNTFYNCTNLTSITIPNSVTTIEAWAFEECVSLAEVHISSIEAWSKISFSDTYGNPMTYAKKLYLNNTLIAENDTNCPMATVSSTNNVASSQKVTLSLSDNVAVVGYYWGTSDDYYSNEYTSLFSGNVCTVMTSDISNISDYKVISDSGTYYLTVKDMCGNISTTYSVTFYKTTFDAMGGTVTPSYVITEYGKSFMPPTPTKDSCEFDGWAIKSSATSGAISGYTPIRDTTHYAVWKYIDTINPTGSISSTNNVATSQTVTLNLNDNVGVAGYYWGTSSNYFSNTYTSTSETSVTKTISDSGTYYLTVKDTSGNISTTYSVTFYKTTFNPYGGSVTPKYVITKAGNSFTPPMPTMDKYSFNGWAMSAGAASGSTSSISPSSNRMYYATWIYSDTTFPTASISCTNNVASSQTVTLNLSDDVGVAGYYWGISSSYSSNTYTLTSEMSVTKTISDSGTYYLTVKDISGNVSTTYSVTFYKTTLNANSGSVSPSYVITMSGNDFIFPTPTRNSYTFNGWSTSSSATSGYTYIDLAPSDDSTYYATWTHEHIYFLEHQELPICTEQGYNIYTCSICGYSYKEYYGSTGHNFNTTIQKATLTKNGSKVTKCTACGVQNSKTIIYYPKSISLSANKYTYDGKVKKPSVKVVDSNGKVVSSSNYTVTYPSGRKNVGKYSIKITFKGDYSGSVTKTFTIIPKGVSVAKLYSPQKAKMSINWKKASGITGYNIQISTSSKFDSKSTVNLNFGQSKTSAIGSATSKKRYYVRIRAYKIVSGTKYYSNWSSAKSVIIK